MIVSVPIVIVEVGNIAAIGEIGTQNPNEGRHHPTLDACPGADVMLNIPDR